MCSFRTGTGWIQQATPSPAGAYGFFGVSVAVSGDTAVVGASQDFSSAGTRGGSAYVFVRTGTTGTAGTLQAPRALQAKLTASDGAAFDLFGASVDVDGDTAVVGAYGDDTRGGGDAGSAFAFRG